MVSEHASPLAALGEADGGGQNVHVAALAAALGRRGVEVVVHTRREDPDVPRRVALAPGAWVDHVDAGPPRRMPKDELLPHMEEFGADLARRWDEDRPDVVHSHFWMSGLAVLEALRRAPAERPVLVHTFHALGVVKRRHQGVADPSPPGRIDLERKLSAVVDRVVATCSDEVFELIRLGADRRRLTVIPCGVDLDLFGPHGPVEPRAPERPRILALDRLVERKGVGDVVAALRHVPEAELVIAGGPGAAALALDAEACRLSRLAAELGVADRVEMRGRVERPDVPALLRSADMAVCVPRYEPFGIVPLEAMACGIPVVASAVGGQIDTVVDGVTGVHVAPGCPDELGLAMRGLLDDPARRRELGAAGARRARARYGWDEIARATLDAYAAARPAEAERAQEVTA